MDKYKALKSFFGYDEFRKGQEGIVDALLNGRDVLAIMPTGAGKSLCYQLPACMFEGITLVISPLIALMNDQVRALNESGIRAAYINSTLSYEQCAKALANAERGVYKVVYVAPERLETAMFKNFAQSADISLIAVDEAHCVSQWGQDFRPKYLEIKRFIDSLGKRPVVGAFTATATELVKDDITKLVGLRKPYTVSTGFDRENLSFFVEPAKNRLSDVYRYVSEHREQSGIIYCSTRKNTDAVALMLNRKGISAVRYHAGLTQQERQEAQDAFIYDKADVIVATNAFGMGIDKSNVRYVIHYNIPQSLEAYYQEAGRAGRDGERSECILYYSKSDIELNKFLLTHKEDEICEMTEQESYRLKKMEGYARTQGCLRKYILNYFGEDTEVPCVGCGNCHGEFTEEDVTQSAKQVVNCVYEVKEKFGINTLVHILCGTSISSEKTNGEGYKTFGRLSELKSEKVKAIIELLVTKGVLIRTEGKYPVIKLGNINILNSEKTVLRTPKRKERKATVAAEYSATLFDMLRGKRRELAQKANLPPYIVFSDKTLMQMSTLKPVTKNEMLNVSGVGEHKYDLYGEEFIKVITEYIENG